MPCCFSARDRGVFERDLYEFNVATGAERVLATAAQILGGAEERLSNEEQARRERMRLAAGGITAFEVSFDGRTILVPFSEKLYLVERATGAIRELTSTAGDPIDARFSPDGKRVACVRGGDLYVTEIASGKERRLTDGATATLTRGLAEFVAQEEMGRMHGYWWSPDSRSSPTKRRTPSMSKSCRSPTRRIPSGRLEVCAIRGPARTMPGFGSVSFRSRVAEQNGLIGTTTRFPIWQACPGHTTRRS